MHQRNSGVISLAPYFWKEQGLHYLNGDRADGTCMNCGWKKNDRNGYHEPGSATLLSIGGGQQVNAAESSSED